MKALFVIPVALIAGCASVPSGPGVLVLPGTGKSFDLFRADDGECRNYAHSQVGGKSAETASTDAGVKSAVVGTAVGAVAGAALGGHSGAATGAGVGLAAGALAGTGAAQSSSMSLQQRYDFGYQQCMYAKGHKIPMSVREAQVRRTATRPAAPRVGTSAPPPPPPGPPPAEAPADYKG